jgi:Fe-S-cluster containining protein
MSADVRTGLQAAFDGERREARALAEAPAASQTVRMYGRLAALQADAIAQRRVEVACARGCSYCCHLRVEMRPHEAFALAEYIDRSSDEARRARIVSALEANLRRIAPLGAAEHVRAGIGCALLEDGACSVYAARPAACRKYYSVSVSTCRDAWRDTRAPLTGELEDEGVRLAGNAVALGFAKGLDDAGYDTALYELHFALLKALTEPKAAKRYRQRKKAFPTGG